MDWTTTWTLISLGHSVLVVLATVELLRRPREPRAMWAWLLALVMLPIVGLVLYFLVGKRKLKRTRIRARYRRQRLGSSEDYRPSIDEVDLHGPIRGEEYDSSVLMKIASRVGGTEPTKSNTVEVFGDGKEAFDSICEAIEAAEHFVHLEYYIFSPDKTGRALRDLLIRKAQQGVECRLLVDYVGCWNWPRKLLRQFREGGVKVEFFKPVIPLRGHFRLNFRNHRKIVIADGLTAYMGSANIGDEYVNKSRHYKMWKDAHLKLTGPCVHDLQDVFAEDWYDATREDLTRRQYFPTPTVPGERRVQIVATGPDRDLRIMHHVFSDAMSTAQSNVLLVTPYFVPDAQMLLAMQSAAYRGARVRVLVPSRTDHMLTVWAGRSHYASLHAAGVEIYELDDCMLHAKVTVVDSAQALVGTANLDERSFKINFEITALLYDAQVASAVEDCFEELFEKARRIMPENMQWSTLESILLGAARMASPLL